MMQTDEEGHVWNKGGCGGLSVLQWASVALLFPADKTSQVSTALPPLPPSLPWVYEAGSQPARVLLKMPG